MTENKYTDEQIMTALESRMNHDEVCREAYDLINSLKSEIEVLKDNNEHLVVFSLEARNKAVKEFAEKLKEHCLEGGIFPALVKNQIEITLKEMEEKDNVKN